MTSGNLNFLEPSGALQACNGLLYLYMTKHSVHKFTSKNKSFFFSNSSFY